MIIYFLTWLIIPFSNYPDLPILKQTVLITTAAIIVYLAALLLEGLIFQIKNQKNIKKLKWNFNFMVLATSFFSLILNLIISITILIWWISVTSNPNYQIYKNFHLFNAHLKSLCVERQDKSECPKNEAELRAFNPEAFNRLQKKAKVFYYFDQLNQQHYLIVKVKNNYFISHQNFYPSFGFFNKNHDYLNSGKYPPDFYGPWDQI